MSTSTNRTRRGHRHRLIRVAAATVVAAAWLTTAATPASASSLTGCSGSAVSLDADGQQIDGATAADGQITDTFGGGTGFTAENPFVVDNQGTVTYDGKSDAVITAHRWSVSVLGVEMVTGGSANTKRTQADTGTLDLADKLPVPITGLVRVEGDLAGTGGACSGDGYVKLQGNPLLSPVAWFGLLFTVAGALGLYWSLPRRGVTRGVGR